MTRRPHLFAPAVVLLAMLAMAPDAVLALDPSMALHQYIHDSWGRKLGLPQNAVHAIAQTTDGYLWLATEQGLARFDGDRMVTFNAANTPALGVNDVRTLLADPAGGLWIGTARHLVRHRGKTFEEVTALISPSDIGVRALAFAPDQALWVVSDLGIHRVAGGKTMTFTIKDGLPDARLTCVLPDGPQSAWVGTMGGLARIESGRVTVLTAKDGLPHDNVFALRATGDGGVWVGTMNGVAQARGGRITRPPDLARLGGVTVRSLFTDEDGGLWIGTVMGVHRLLNHRLESLPSQTGSLNETIVSIATDREGSLWLGTMFGGLHRLRSPPLALVDRNDGLAGENIACVMEGRDRSMWIGLVDAGLDRLQGGRVIHYGVREGLPSASIRALAEGSDGTVWVGTTAGVARMAGGRFVEVGPVEGRPREPVAAIAIDRAGSLWLGTSSGTVRLKDNRWIKYSRADGMPTEPGWAIRVMKSGDVWIGTDGGGAARYDGTRFETFNTVRGGLVGQVLDIHEDAAGVIWLATDQGILRYKNGSFRSIDQSQGLLDDTVFRILEDADGNFWISANVGVARMAKRDVDAVMDGAAPRVNSLILGSDAGAKDAECNGAVQPSGWLASDGRIWFSTSAGAAVIDPRRVRRNTNVPSVLIEEIRVGETSYDALDGVTLPAGQEAIRLKFTALTFIAPNAVQFKVKLDGADTDWHGVGNERTETYANPAPGTYTFRVMAANADGVWNETGAALTFKKLPFFYQTWWFRGVLLFGVVALVAGSVYWRLRQHARREAELTRRIDEAVAQIKRLHGMIPICAWCKKIRTDAGSWQQVEVYVRDHTEATFSHGICPDCHAKIEGELSSKG